MNVNTNQMRQYAQFLDEQSSAIISLCNNMERALEMAVQCMDQSSGRNAANRMRENLENVRRDVPYARDAANRLVQATHYIDSAIGVFGG